MKVNLNELFEVTKNNKLIYCNVINTEHYAEFIFSEFHNGNGESLVVRIYILDETHNDLMIFGKNKEFFIEKQLNGTEVINKINEYYNGK